MHAQKPSRGVASTRAKGSRRVNRGNGGSPERGWFALLSSIAAAFSERESSARKELLGLFALEHRRGAGRSAALLDLVDGVGQPAAVWFAL